MGVHTHTHTYEHEHAQVIGEAANVSFHHLSLIALRQALSLNRKFTVVLSWLGSELLPTACLCPSNVGIILGT